MKLQDGDVVLFTGDSITDCGRERPVGKKDALGDGYVGLVNDFLEITYPENNFEILNTGIGGHKVTDLQKRWQTDVIDLNPDWLSILVGINDVWHQLIYPENKDIVDIDLFESTYRELLAETRPNLKGLVLMTPYYYELSLDDNMRKMMDDYGKIVKKMAEEFDAYFIDLQKVFNDYLKYRKSETLSADKIHPNRAGHLMIAKEFLKAIELDW